MSERRTLMPPDMDAEIELHLFGIPMHMRRGLLDYLRYGTRPGQFLEAVLSNDLAEAAARADAENQQALYEYVFVLTNYAPCAAWGGPDSFQGWLDKGRELRTAQQIAGAIVAATSTKEQP